MSEANDFRLNMVEQKLSIMQKEVSEVLGELQVMVGASISGNQRVSEDLARRVIAMENAVAALIQKSVPITGLLVDVPIDIANGTEL